MKRLKTQIWRGGVNEILADSSAALGPSVALAATRILTADEVSEMRRVLGSSTFVPPSPPARARSAPARRVAAGQPAHEELARPAPDAAQRSASPERTDSQIADAQVRSMEASLGRGRTRWQLAALVLVLCSVGVGGWFSQRASATGKPKLVPASVAQQTAATRQTAARPLPLAPTTEPADVAPTVEPMVASSQPVSPVDASARPARRSRWTPPVVLAPAVLPRAAVDALAAGDHTAAAAIYRELSASGRDPALFEAAAEILLERARDHSSRTR